MSYTLQENWNKRTELKFKAVTVDITIIIIINIIYI